MASAWCVNDKKFPLDAHLSPTRLDVGRNKGGRRKLPVKKLFSPILIYQ